MAFNGAFEGLSIGPSRRRPRVFKEKAEGFDRAFYRVFYRAFEEKAGGASRRNLRVFSELNRGRNHRLHPLGEYIITLYTNGKLRTRVTVTLVSRAD
ncbi:hypothetical protein Tco_0293688, partial [Tanacetum coccineum]